MTCARFADAIYTDTRTQQNPNPILLLKTFILIARDASDMTPHFNYRTFLNHRPSPISLITHHRGERRCLLERPDTKSQLRWSRNCTRSAWPKRLATMMGVSPPALVTFRLAPAVKRCSATLRWPASQTPSSAASSSRWRHTSKANCSCDLGADEDAEGFADGDDGGDEGLLVSPKLLLLPLSKEEAAARSLSACCAALYPRPRRRGRPDAAAAAGA